VAARDGPAHSRPCRASAMWWRSRGWARSAPAPHSPGTAASPAPRLSRRTSQRHCPALAAVQARVRCRAPSGDPVIVSGCPALGRWIRERVPAPRRPNCRVLLAQPIEVRHAGVVTMSEVAPQRTRRHVGVHHFVRTGGFVG
jgi:hypothetical protein